ncbi:ROK family transcriptional regulator [Clostridioides difficile]
MVTDKYTIREMNERLVLEQIIKNGPISRASIASTIGLNKATISAITKKLIDESLVHEIGIGNSTHSGGRKPILLVFNKCAGISLSMDIGYDYIFSSLSYLDGTIVNSKNLTDIQVNKDNVIQLIDEIINSYNISKIDTPYDVIGFTLAIHGITCENKILFTPYYNLNEIDLYSILSEKYDFPIHIENEANLTALAESTFSTVHNSLLSLSIHSGFGSGIIINNKLYNGRNGMSGEIGHTIIMPNGKPCPCGNLGCLEQYCSEKKVFEQLSSLENISKIDSNTVKQLYYANNQNAKKVIQEFCSYLSIAINNAIATYAPEIIYLNSQIIRDIPEILQITKDMLVSSFNKGINIEISSLGSEASLYGGSAVNIKSFLNIQNLTLMNEINDKITTL